MEVKVGDFVKVDYDMFANRTLVQTTDEKKGVEAKLNVKTYGPVIMIIGKNFLLKAFDEAILENSEGSIDLSVDEAFGKKDKKLIRTFPKSTFDKQKMRVVVGVTYDFNGMFGTVKAVNGGRVMVDFNNPLVGKEIKIDYKVVSVIEDISEKVAFVIKKVLKLPENLFDVSSNDLKVIIKGPKELLNLKEQLIGTLTEFIFEFHEYELILEEKVISKK